MKSLPRASKALASTIAVLITAFAAPVDGEVSGSFDPSEILRPPVLQTGELLAFDMNRVVSTQTRLIRYQATEYQRKVAEQRARAYVAAQRRILAKPHAPAPSKEVPKKSHGPAPAEEKETPAKPQKSKPEEPTAAAKPKELPRYIAVDTVKDKRASPTAKKVVMIWDTHAEALVGNNLYDVQNPPAVGATTNFETYSAQYIGAGL